MKITQTMLILAFGMLAANTAQAQPLTPDWSQAEEIDIVMTNYEFMPNEFQLQANTPYLLHLTNDGSKGHNFSAKELFAEAMIAEGDIDKIDDGKIEVKKGESVDVLFIPVEPGVYSFHCSHFMHSSLGMKGEATVQ